MRVRRLKQLLIFGPYIAVIIPVVLCVILLVTAYKQRARINETEEKLSLIQEEEAQNAERLESLNQSVEKLSQQVENLNSLKLQSEDEGTKADTDDSDRSEWPKKVYLTFDDGPSTNTEKILDILKEEDVKANFFVVGTESDKLKKMYKRILDEGHVLGMHSYSHKYSDIYSSREAFIADLDKITQLIYDETGFSPKYYRFPGGSVNTVSRVNMDELIPVLEARNLTYFDWNIASGDATNPMLPTESIIKNSLDSIDGYEEAMILFHDLSNKTSTVEALPSIIEELKERNIPIALIDDTTISIKHNNK